MVFRRRTSSRKSRVKPRSKKSMKQPKLASADISTQETTTPGPEQHIIPSHIIASKHISVDFHITNIIVKHDAP